MTKGWDPGACGHTLSLGCFQGKHASGAKSLALSVLPTLAAAVYVHLCV